MTAARVKGRPLRAGAVLLVGWIAARALLWESPLVSAALPTAAPETAVAASAPAAPRAAPQEAAEPAVPMAAPVPLLPVPAPVISPPVPPPLFVPVTVIPAPAPAPAPPPLGRVTLAAGHNLLLLAAVAHLPMPDHIQAALAANRRAQGLPAGLPQASPAAGPRRWSADGWLLWRQGLGPLRAQNGFVAPAYGARQIGAVIRYRLDPSAPAKPALYLRAAKALERARDEELAAGLSLRPLAAVPVVVGAELRASRALGQTRVSPAVLAVTELPTARLPLGLEAEAYAQGGYVGGAYATPFADGQLRLTRKVALGEAVRVDLGAGAWGGAQRGAARLDVGPTASLALRTGPATTRLSADWRFRVAGDAIPKSGPAITLSAGF